MEAEVEDEGPRSFARFLERLADGEAHAEASQELHALCCKLRDEAVARHTPITGELHLKIALRVEPNGLVGLAYAIKKKEPDPARSKAAMYITKGGNLTIENPRQQKLPLREVNQATGPAREVDAPADAKEV